MSKNISKANEDSLNALHQLIAQHLTELISSKQATTQDINAAIKFLKDNDVTADLTYNKPLTALEGELGKVHELPFIVEDEDDLEENNEVNG